MSWSSFRLGIKKQTGSGHNKLVLICLANFADENWECFPSYKTICQITELSRSTIIRCIKSLEEKGIIEVKTRFSEIGGGNRQTSNLYKLNIGFQIDTHGFQVDTHPSIRKTPHLTNHKKTNKKEYSEEFLQWWNLYPRNDGSKIKAFDLWKKITDKEIDADDLWNRTVKFKQTMKGKEEKFIPHATTWLNQKRYETVNFSVEDDKNKTKKLNQLVG